MADINISQFTKPIDTAVKIKQLFDAVDKDKKDGISDAEKDDFIKAQTGLSDSDKKVLEANIEVARKAAPPKFEIDSAGNVKIKTVGGNEVSFPKEQLSVSHLKDSAEEKAWRESINSTKGKTVIVDSEKGLATVKKALGDVDPIKDPAKAADNLVKELWENEDGININGKFEKRRIVRMEEILGAQKLIATLEKTNPAEAAKFKNDFFAKMGEYINKFGDEAQFTFDTFIALFQSTAWGEGGHTNELKKFYEEMLQGMAQTANVTKDKLSKLKDGESIVLGNSDGTQDGNPFGSLAFIGTKKGDSISFDFVEHATAPKENKAIGVDSTKAKEDLQKVVAEAEKLDQSKLSTEQKKSVSDLKGIDLPAILSGGKDGLTVLLKNLEVIKGLPGLSSDNKTIIESLISQVNKLISQAEAKASTSTQESSSTSATSPPASTTTSPGTPSVDAKQVDGTTTGKTSAAELDKLKQDTISFLNGLKASKVSDKAATTASSISKLTEKSEEKDVNGVLTALEGMRKDLETGDKNDPNIKKIEETISKLKTFYSKLSEPTKTPPPGGGALPESGESAKK